MTSLNVIAWGAALGFLYFSLLCIAAWRRLWHIPGPFWARFTHLWIIRRILTGDYIQGLLDLHIKYGPVVVVAPNFVSLSDPEEIRQIGKVRSKWGRAEGYHAFRLAPGTSGDSILSVRDDKAHARMRAKLMPGYAGRTVEGVEQMVNKHVSQLGEVILSRHITTPGKSYHPVDFSRLAEHLTIDIITSFAFQESFDCLERDDDFHGYLEAVRKAVAPLVAFAFIPMYARMMDISALGALFPEGGFLPRIFEVAKRQVHKRYGEEAHVLKGRNDVLSTWIAGGLSEDELVNETVAQLGAGGETTSTGIRATMLYLLTSPHAYRALQREIDDALRLRLVTSCPLSEKEVNHLPYLQAVVKESIRLIAPAGFFPKSSPSDEMLCGYRIPAGVSVELAFKPALRDEVFPSSLHFQ